MQTWAAHCQPAIALTGALTVCSFTFFLRIDGLQPAEEVPLGFEYAFDVVTETPGDVERMVNSTVNITVKEHFKEKKKKNETVTRLGHVSIDALPLLLGESSVEGTYELVQESSIFLPQALTLDVCVTAPHPLMNEHQVSTLNILTCSIKGKSSVVCVPERLCACSYPYSFIIP